MALHREGPDDFVTEPIDQPIDQLLNGDDVPSDAPSPPPPHRHSSPEGARRSLSFLRSIPRSGGLWWKVLVVLVVIWALGRFGGDPPSPASVAPAAPTCTQPAPKTSGQTAFTVGKFLLPHNEGQ